MVMDMFYAYVEMKRKKRVHFHGFMLDVHKSKWSGRSDFLVGKHYKIVSLIF